MLRVYFDAPPVDTHAFTWVLFDARGHAVREGRDVLARLPTSQTREAVLDVSLVTCFTLDLPPMNAARREAAIRLALEDKLVTPVAQQHVVAEPLANDHVSVRVVDKALLDVLRKLGFSRVIAETDLVQSTAKSWHCCAENHKGFVRRDDGSAFAVEINAVAPPVELLLALKQSVDKPTTLRLNTPQAGELREKWQSVLPASVNIVSEKIWQWAHTPSENFVQAPNLLPVENVAPSNASAHPRWQLALKLAALALALHVLLTGVAWSMTAWQHGKIKREWQTLAREAGLSYNNATVQRDWARAYAHLRHEAGLAAPDDALPLLARAAPALSLLPENSLRRAVYADAAWTLEWQAVDALHRTNVENALRQAGLFVMSGGDANTYRLRIQAQNVTP